MIIQALALKQSFFEENKRPDYVAIQLLLEAGDDVIESPNKGMAMCTCHYDN